MLANLLEMSSVLSKTNCVQINVRALCTLVSSKLNYEEGEVKGYESIPGMKKLQLIRAFVPGGKLHNIGTNEIYRRMREEFGDIYKFPGMFGRKDIVTVFNPKDIEKVFRSEGKHPHRIGLDTLQYYRKNIRPEIYGEFGSLVLNENWSKMRSIVNPVMMKPGIVKGYVPHVDEISKDFINMILKLRDSNNEVPANFGNYVNMWSLESITCITINRRLGLLSDDIKDETAKQLIEMVRRYFNLGYLFETRPQIWKIYATKSFKEMVSILDTVTNIIIDYVDKAMKDLESKPKEDREESILEKLVKINRNVAVVMCSDSLAAGVDTITSSTIGILYCLAKNQDKQDKLRDELRQNFPNATETLSAETLARFPYLRAVIKESMRLFPPVSASIRQVAEDVVLCGYHVPKGTGVCTANIFSYQNDEYFDQAKQFVPERWLKNVDEACPVSFKKSHPFAFLPFGVGARGCVGRRIAEMEMEVLITRMIRDYKIEWNYSDMKVKSVLLNIPDGDLKFKITKI